MSAVRVGRAASAIDGEDLVVSLVEGWADEVVHRRVGDDEALGAVLLGVEDAGEQRAGLGDEEATGLQEQVGVEAVKCRADGRGVSRDRGCRVEGFVAVLDAEASAAVDVADVVAVGAELVYQGSDALERLGEGLDGADLGADVDADACRLEVGELGGAAIDLAGGLDGDAELVLAEAGGDVGMGFGEDVRVDAEGDLGGLAAALARWLRIFELGFALYVEEEDVGAESCVHLPDLLAYSGEDDAAEGCGSGAADPLELSSGDDVEAAALLAEQLQDGQRGVGFDRVAERVWDARKLCLKHRYALVDGVGGVDVEGRAVGFGQLREIGA